MNQLAVVVLLIISTLLNLVHSQCDNSNPCVFTGGDALITPDQKTSSGGTLSITLDVDITDILFEWLTVARRTYNGKIPGPTWRVKRGDVVTVTLMNSLSLPQKEEAFNQFRYPNSTNLHTHGLHISSMEPQDNVFVHVNPGDSYTYVYQIDPENPAGTYWYHPHLHGSTSLQVAGGLAGMLIVEDPTTGSAAMPPGLAAVSCPNNCNHEVELLFQPCLSYSNGGRGYAELQRDIEDSSAFRSNLDNLASGNGNLETWLETNTNIYTTNGQVYPVLTIPAGQIKRFRMVNAAGSATLELLIVDQGSTTATSGCEFKEIAFDGIYLNEARDARLGKTLLIPASKGDWLVVCNTPGNYEVRSVPSNADAFSMGNFERYTGLMFSITVTGSATSTTIPTALPAREVFVSDFKNLTEAEVRGHFVIEVDPGTQLNRAKFASATDYRFKCELNTIQQWYLINTDSTTGHPIHIHVNHFQVISYNAYTGPIGTTQGPTLVMYDQSGNLCNKQSASYAAATNIQVRTLPPNSLQYLGHDARAAAGGAGTLGYVELGEFRDIIIVPPLANITIRFKANKFVGGVVIHCHILVHEDVGMMMNTEIISPGQSLAANPTTLSGNAYPGQCGACDPYPFNQVVTDCTETTQVLISGGTGIRSDLDCIIFLQVISALLGILVM